MGVGEMGVGKTGQIIGETGVGEMGVNLFIFIPPAFMPRGI